MLGMLLLILLALMMFMLFQTTGSGETKTLRDFEVLWENQQIEEDSVVSRESGITARQKEGVDGKRPTTIVIPVNAADREHVAREVYRITGGKVQSKRPSAFLPFLWSFGPLLLLILLIWFFVIRGIRSAGAGGGMLGNFGKSRHRTLTKEMTGITFKDVAGIDEAKDEVAEIIEFLRSPKRFTRLGGRIPRGVLLTGPPGCGKTLLAKAIAGEADVPFFSISGSDFVEMFVGVGASRVRDLFKQAKESSPCIIFLDEIDAVGRKRGGGFNTGGHDEREQTLNAILVEMDGFNATDGVIVIAATNRPDVLDPALIRPGRFDRQINVPLPDVKGRLEILRVHAKKVKLGSDVDLERLAKLTPMFSGADLAAIINEAAIAATMLNKDYIEQVDLEEARDKVRFGRAKKSRVREKEDNRLVAFHEAGHAVLQAMLPDGDPLHKVTVIPRGDAGGATFSLPEKDRLGYSLKWLRATMISMCGGRIAEERAMGDVSSGAVGDIAQVTNIARMMVLEWGMSDKLGFVRYAGSDTREMYVPDREYSEDTARLIDQEVRRIVDEAYTEAERLLTENWEKVVTVAEALLRHETLSREEVEKLLRGEALSKPTVSDILAAEARKVAAEARPAASTDPESDLPPGVAPRPA
ncbi:MAG: ATP-dependent zinc metalloprotease FtsH [Phycisphaeraceae bacterium]|nr:ATP-dependent zinc metalloprotease FtsH [Phycisphaeraceae bacterium]MCW5753772.1 ATP-dependent zinc metalloprotease FtsH [Phycisphaeraceae bacterium]